MTHQPSSPVPQQALRLREDQQQTGGTSLLYMGLWAPQKLAGTRVLLHYTVSCFWSQQAWLGWDKNRQLNIRRGCLRSWAIPIFRNLRTQIRQEHGISGVGLAGTTRGRCCAGRAGRFFPAGKVFLPVSDSSASQMSSQTLWGVYLVHMKIHVVFLFHIAIAYCNGILQGQKIGTFRCFFWKLLL